MENGFNVARKGVVSFIRLNTLRARMGFMVKELERLYGRKRITDVTDREIVAFFRMMRDGRIRKKDGGKYTSVSIITSLFS